MIWYSELRQDAVGNPTLLLVTMVQQGRSGNPDFLSDVKVIQGCREWYRKMLSTIPTLSVRVIVVRDVVGCPDLESVAMHPRDALSVGLPSIECPMYGTLDRFLIIAIAVLRQEILLWRLKWCLLWYDCWHCRRLCNVCFCLYGEY